MMMKMRRTATRWDESDFSESDRKYQYVVRALNFRNATQRGVMGDRCLQYRKLPHPSRGHSYYPTVVFTILNIATSSFHIKSKTWHQPKMEFLFLIEQLKYRGFNLKSTLLLSLYPVDLCTVTSSNWLVNLIVIASQDQKYKGKDKELKRVG